jgi:hypothetical protein
MPTPISNCSMKSGCSHVLDFGLASPLPLTVFAPLEPLLTHQALGPVSLQVPASAFTGFRSAPFEPPRS